MILYKPGSQYSNCLRVVIKTWETYKIRQTSRKNKCIGQRIWGDMVKNKWDASSSQILRSSCSKNHFIPELLKPLQHRSLQFPQCLGQPPQTCPQGFFYEGMARMKVQRLYGVFSWSDPAAWSWDPSSAISYTCSASTLYTFLQYSVSLAAMFLSLA